MNCGFLLLCVLSSSAMASPLGLPSGLPPIRIDSPEHGDRGGCGDNCVVVTGERPHHPTPNHPNPDDHLHRPGGGGMVGPQATDEQRLASRSYQAFLRWKDTKDKNAFEFYITQLSVFIDSHSGGFEVEEALADLKGAVIGSRSSSSSTYAEATRRLEVTIEVKKPYSIGGVTLPFRSTSVTIKDKTGRYEMLPLLIFPKTVTTSLELMGRYPRQSDLEWALGQLTSGAKLSEMESRGSWRFPLPSRTGHL